MTDARDALKAGIDSLAAFISKHELAFVHDSADCGSGGYFARGSLVSGNCRVNLSYRYGLGDIRLDAAGLSMPFDEYLRAIGVYSSARYPSTRAGAADQFDALAHDLGTYCAEFLAGAPEQFVDAHRRWKASTRDPMIAWVGDTRARAQAGEAFRSKDFACVVKLLDKLQYPEDLSASERKMYDLARSRIGPG